MTTLSVEHIAWELIDVFLTHPFPQICKHLAALHVLNMLEKNGYDIDSQLVKSIVDCDDEHALQLNTKRRGVHELSSDINQ